MDKPAIEKIVFNVRGKKLELTSDEAKELKQILSDLFGSDSKVVHEWHQHSYPYYPYYPYKWPYATWTCENPTYTMSSLAGSNITSATSDTLYLNVK